ncbi:MAG: hypothetical protein FK733_19580 [Asgard group archaeon]|nr:hypothetical protein [Asgard group archaeon]
MNLKKNLIGLTLIGLFLATAGAQLVSAANTEIGVSENAGATIITTDYITIRIVPDQGHIMWWHGNMTDANEMYKLQLVKIQEFMGDDAVLDDKTELAGVAQTLIALTWEKEIVLTETQIFVNLSTSLPNGAKVTLLMHVYNDNTPVPGSDAEIDALTEMKFDIIVEDWDFSPMAQGYAIQAYCTEVQHRHTVRLRNGTATEYGNATRNIQFESDSYDIPVAYFEWTTFASIYNSTLHFEEDIPVGTAYFDDLISPPTEAPGFAEGLAHLLLYYENYGDDKIMVHDPSIGINSDAVAVPLFVWPIVTGLFIVATATILVTRKKR